MSSISGLGLFTASCGFNIAWSKYGLELWRQLSEIERLESASLSPRALAAISGSGMSTSNENLRGSLPRNDSEMSLGFNHSNSMEKDLNELGEFCQGGQAFIFYFKHFALFSIATTPIIYLLLNPSIIMRFLFGSKNYS